MCGVCFGVDGAWREACDMWCVCVWRVVWCLVDGWVVGGVVMGGGWVVVDGGCCASVVQGSVRQSAETSLVARVEPATSKGNFVRS